MKYFEMIAVARKEADAFQLKSDALDAIIRSRQPTVHIRCAGDERDALQKYLKEKLELISERAYVEGHGLKVYLE